MHATSLERILLWISPGAWPVKRFFYTVAKYATTFESLSGILKLKACSPTWQKLKSLAPVAKIAQISENTVSGKTAAHTLGSTTKNCSFIKLLPHLDRRLKKLFLRFLRQRTSGWYYSHDFLRDMAPHPHKTFAPHSSACTDFLFPSKYFPSAYI